MIGPAFKLLVKNCSIPVPKDSNEAGSHAPDFFTGRTPTARVWDEFFNTKNMGKKIVQIDMKDHSKWLGTVKRSSDTP